jgi:uncharacterized protein YjeT (DUF2065 family)
LEFSTALIVMVVPGPWRTLVVGMLDDSIELLKVFG